ncbi:MAG: DoxX family protein [Sphingobacteriales bacterium]|nr:DoxX family protein [Sphingobacteriales bacterium]
MDLITLIGLFAAIAFALTILGKFLLKQQNIAINFIRYFVGVWFIFSGVVKAIDPTGTAIKMEEYFEMFEKYVPALTFLWKIMAEQALAVSVLMIVLEIYLGIALILGTWKKSTIWLLVLLIAFFTFLTGFSAKTGKVTDCGCFGDFIKLAPVQSFYKDVFLTALILIILFGQKSIKEILPKRINKVALLLLTLAAVVFTFRNIYYEPIKDFRPYSVGTSIPDCLKLPPNAKPYKYENTFIYKNKKSGEVKEFKNSWPQDMDNWTFVDRKDVMIQKGDDPKCKDFAIKDANGGDNSSSFFEEEEHIFFIIIPDLKKVCDKGFDKIRPIAEAAAKEGKYVFILTGSIISDVQAYEKKYNMDYEIYNADATPLKTIMRSNPGLLILKKGVIAGKYHYNELSTYDALKKSVLK